MVHNAYGKSVYGKSKFEWLVRMNVRQDLDGSRKFFLLPLTPDLKCMRLKEAKRKCKCSA